jgi:uncharacterized repeat protein (TIGR03843 family)
LARKRTIKVSLSKSEPADPLSDPFSGLLSGETFGEPSEPLAATSQDNAPLQVTETEVLTVLTHGEISEQGLLPYSSNHSFLVTATLHGMTLPAVYKPRRGENPLWDFDWGTLCQRETAAYLVSKTLGWDLVPPTVLREGTRGVGSVQLFISNNDSEHYFTVQEDARFVPSLRRLALFDFVVNNADRKSGHCLLGDDQRLWAIDHGICFHTEYKLRTVIWEFSEMPIDTDMINDLQGLHDCLIDERTPLCQILCQLLTSAERSAMLARTKILLQKRTFPSPQMHRRNYPWPPI